MVPSVDNAMDHPRAHGLCHGPAHGRIVIHGIVLVIVHGRPWGRPWTTPWRRVSMASFMDDTMISSMGDATDVPINVDHPVLEEM